MFCSPPAKPGDFLLYLKNLALCEEFHLTLVMKSSSQSYLEPYFPIILNLTADLRRLSWMLSLSKRQQYAWKISNQVCNDA